MPPMLCCVFCKRWRVIEEETAYCSVCTRPLQTDDFEEMIGLDQEAATECPALLGRWNGEVGCALAIMCGVATFTESWVPHWLELTLMEWLVFTSAVVIIRRHRQAKAMLRTKYARLWSIPTVFRPSVEKP